MRNRELPLDSVDQDSLFTPLPGSIIKSKRYQSTLLPIVIMLIAACGGHHSDGNNSTAPIGGDWVTGVFQPASTFEARCAEPRSGTDPDSGRPFPDIQGTAVDENNWLRSWSNDTYLWYDEIVDRDPALYAVPEYFELLKTDATTPSGTPKDKFHFTYTTEEWRQLSQSGVSAGYGAQWAIISASRPREVLVAYTEPGSPADNAGLARGAEILVADGVDVINGIDADTLNAAFFPEQAGESHTFTVLDLGSASTRSFTMESANVTSQPVQNTSVIPTASGDVGYMLFNDHIATAEQGLADAVATLDSANIVDLILDIRYNGGGYLAIASQLAYMIAGNIRTNGEIFESIQFNDKYPVSDPVTGELLTPIPFINTTVGLSTLPAGQALPTLDLARVFVLTGPGTCSASESIINSLSGINVEVIQIGSTTCGKPYGFYPTDNCGTTYFTIQFKGKNALGFGDYSDGFSPANTTGLSGTLLPGCSVADDFTAALGDPAENRLAAALAYRETGICPSPTGNTRRVISSTAASAPRSAVDGETPKSVWLQNRILSW